MGKRHHLFGIFLLIVVITVSACNTSPQPAEPPPEKATEAREWIVKWKSEPDEAFLQTVEVIRKDGEDPNTMLVRVKESIDQDKWRAEWMLNQNIEYIQPNFQYKINNAVKLQVDQPHSISPIPANDYFLDVTKAREARERWEPRREVIIAVIDTGVDSSHPLIAPHLVNPTNIVYPGSSADDITIDDVWLPEEVGKSDEEIYQMYQGRTDGSIEDYYARIGAIGHGTSVTGVILQMLGLIDGDEPVQSTEHSAKIMPIKVMGFRDGIKEGGSDFDMAEAIRVAVKRGAHIISLSLGDWAYSQNARDAINYAEQSGVLVVAAAGNQQQNINEPIFYPAALPEVLAVGGITIDSQSDTKSNVGDGLDLVAPDEWIWTTDVGGGFRWMDGNSFATPQVTAVAAMVMQQYPDMTPKDVRNLLRQTADRDEGGWNKKTGYGRLNALRAVTEQPKRDIFEYNDMPERAARIPLDSRIDAALESPSEVDWYVYNLPEMGEGLRYQVSLQLSFDETLQRGVVLLVILPGSQKVLSYPLQNTDELLLTTGPGELRVGIQFQQGKPIQTMDYTLENRISMEPDSYADNSHQWKAYNLDPLVNQFIVGTFHKDGEQDWYRIKTSESGNLNIRLFATSPRIDPVLFVQQLGGTYGVLLDDMGPMGEEQLSIRVETEGVYYIRVTDANISASLGRYHLLINYEPDASNGTIANYRSDQAITLMSGETPIEANLSHASLYDWYQFDMGRDEEATILIQDVEEPSKLEMTVYDERLTVIARDVINPEQNGLLWKGELAEGRYFVRVKRLSEEHKTPYRISLFINENNR